MVEMIKICKRSNWHSVLVLIWLLYSNVKSEIIEQPVDTEVGIGESTHLNCSTSDTSGDINWYHEPVGKGSSDLRYVFMSGQMLRPYNERFRIEKDSSTGAFNLVIAKVEVEDAGRYICQNGGPPATAELIVLESLPTCTSNINSNGFIGPNSCGLKNEEIQLSCGIKYHGNVPPKLQWTRIQHGKSVSIPEECIASDGRFTCNYTAESDMEMDGSSFICQSSRSIDTQYNCKTEPVKILYSSENKTRIVKTIGDEVTCSANTSSTDCKYKWIWYDGDDEETVSEISALAINREGYHRCEATCAIKDFRCLVRAMTIKSSAIVVAPVKDSSTTVVVLVATVLVCLCIIVSLIVYFKRKVAALRRKTGINAADAGEVPSEQGRLLLTENSKLLDRNDDCEANYAENDGKCTESLPMRHCIHHQESENNAVDVEEVPSEQGRPLSAEDSELPAKNVDAEANNAENDGNRAESLPMMTLRHQQESKNSDDGKQPQWTCKKCTFTNLEKNVSCEICATSKSHETTSTDEESSKEDANETGPKKKGMDE